MLRAGAALTAPCTDHGGRRTAFFAATPDRGGVQRAPDTSHEHVHRQRHTYISIDTSDPSQNHRCGCANGKAQATTLCTLGPRARCAWGTCYVLALGCFSDSLLFTIFRMSQQYRTCSQPPSQCQLVFGHLLPDVRPRSTCRGVGGKRMPSPSQYPVKSFGPPFGEKSMVICHSPLLPGAGEIIAGSSYNGGSPSPPPPTMRASW